MNHFSMSLTTAAFLLFSSSALAQSTSIYGAIDLQPDVPSISSVAQSDTGESESVDDANYWQSQAPPDWHLKEKEQGIQIAPGQYHGNRGPASEEQGIQFEFFAR